MNTPKKRNKIQDIQPAAIKTNNIEREPVFVPIVSTEIEAPEQPSLSHIQAALNRYT